MFSESVVYGCIRDWPVRDAGEQLERVEHNRQVLAALPAAEVWSLLSRDMFSCMAPVDQLAPTSQVIHFAASYRSVEYEWDAWVRQFEALLKRLYWSTTVVHLETESNGAHRFSWQSESFGLQSLQEQLQLRCTWEREGMLTL